jgi:hypothetical protein
MEGLASFMGSRRTARGAGVAREGAGRAVHGGPERRQWGSMVAAALCP